MSTLQDRRDIVNVLDRSGGTRGGYARGEDAGAIAKALGVPVAELLE